MEKRSERKVVLITGAARRVGQCLATSCHQQGMNILLHYNQSETEAKTLAKKLNDLRGNSCHLLQAELSNIDNFPNLVVKALQPWQRVDVLINNASAYYTTPINYLDPLKWDHLMTINAKAPLFLSIAFAECLRAQNGCIVNILDIHSRDPLGDYSLYSISKAAFAMVTKSLAKELAPVVRVNAVAPGIVIWPEGDNAVNDTMKKKLLNKIPMQRIGSPEDIAAAVLYCLSATYVTGQVITVDGGRSV